MKQFVPLMILLLIGSSFIGCKSTKKAYERGEYKTAVLNSIERLRKSPNNKKSLETLRLAYPDFLDFTKSQIDRDKLSNNSLRWEDIMDNYALLNRVYDEIQRSPAARAALPRAQSFNREYESAKLNAAEARYALGMDALDAGKNGNREAAKEAYRHFRKASRLQDNFRGSNNLAMEARDLATVIVQIEKIPMHSRMFDISNEFFENQLSSFIRDNPGGPFVRFIAADEKDRLTVEPHHVLRMRFDDFVVGQTYVHEKEAERLREIKVGEEEVAKDSVVDVFETVSAVVHIFTKEVNSSGLLDLRIESSEGSLITQEKFAGTFVYEDFWGYYNGDKRALDDQDKRRIRRRNPGPDPLPQDLFIEFTKPIFDQVTRYINDYYAAF